MRKNIFFTALALFLSCAPHVRAGEPEYRLTMTTPYMDRHYLIGHVFRPWADEIARRTGGRVEISIYNPNTICPDSEVYDAVTSGAIDIGSHMFGRTPGKFPYASVVEVPLIARGSESGSMTVWSLYKENDDVGKEFKDTKMLWCFASALHQVTSRKAPYTRLEQLSGVKTLVVGSGALDLAKSLGMAPVSTSYPDAYLSLQRGMADAMIATLAIMRSNKINEATESTTICNLRMSGIYVVMNRARWDSLPEDVRAVFTELGGDVMAARTGRGLDDASQEDRKYFERHGHTFHVLPPDEMEKWTKAVYPVREKWLRDVEARGLDKGPAVLEQAVRLGREWSERIPRTNYE